MNTVYEKIHHSLNHPDEQVISDLSAFLHGPYEAPEDPAWPTPASLREAEALLEELPDYLRLICHATAVEMLFPMIVNYGIYVLPTSTYQNCISLPKNVEPLLKIIYECFFDFQRYPSVLRGEYHIDQDMELSDGILPILDIIHSHYFQEQENDNRINSTDDPIIPPEGQRIIHAANAILKLIEETQSTLQRMPLNWTNPRNPNQLENTPPRSTLERSLEAITFGIENPEARQEAISRFLIHWWTRCRCRLAFMDPNKAELQ